MTEEAPPAPNWFANLAPHFAAPAWKKRGREKKPEPEPLVASEARQDRRQLALYSPEASSLPAPRQSDLEKQIRASIWSHMSPALAREANLTLSELIDWTSGVGRLSALQTTAIAMTMGQRHAWTPSGRAFAA
jgi:hypothetical protein